jgi:integrase
VPGDRARNRNVTPVFDVRIEARREGIDRMGQRVHLVLANLSEKAWDNLRTINLHWHDLRHEALSRLGESGELTDHELMEIAGHANLTTQRYLNTRVERLKQGVLRAAAKRPA